MEVSTTVCGAGGGPAGMFLGLLPARAGVAVVVLDKRGDFLRDFRGDTVPADGHPGDRRLDRPETGDPRDTVGHIDAEGMAVAVPRHGYYQCALPVATGSLEEVRDAGLDAFRERMARTVPFLRPVVAGRSTRGATARAESMSR